MKKDRIYTLLICVVFAVQLASAQDKGTVKIDALDSKALADNLTKEDTTRPLAIYLPPRYSTSNKRYPVLYLLHGIGDDHLNFVDDSDNFATIQGLMDYGVASQRFGEIIIVMPNQKTNWFGSFYTNSSVTGNWEDFTAFELVNYVDTNYRTIAKANSRAVAGHSMGGYGAIKLAMKHPDIFSVAYSMSGGFVSFTGEINRQSPGIKKFVIAKNSDELLATRNRDAIGLLTVSQAFSPNPQNPPFYADKPFKLQGNRLVPNPHAYNKWLENDVVQMAEKYKNNLLKLRAIKFDTGNEDEFKFIVANNRLFSKKLTVLKIPHEFEEYNGDHRNRLWGLRGRIYSELLPFVFDNLDK